MASTVLITGATGFTGSFLVDRYLELGWTVHGTSKVPRLSKSPADSVGWHVLDLVDEGATRRLVQAVRPDVVHHLAAQSSVAVSFEDPRATYADNVFAQQSLLDALLAYAPDCAVVVAGSCDEYGDVKPEENPVSEQQELRPMNAYAVSKVAQDLMGYQYYAAGMRVVRTRSFLQLGPRRSDRFVAGGFARQVAEVERGIRRPTIEVGSVDLVRDFTDVRDVAQALVSIGERGEPGAVYNVASGEGRTLRTLLDIMIENAGLEVDVVASTQLRRRREPPALVGDASLLRDHTGWRPTIGFEDSAIDTLNYWRGRVDDMSATKGR